MHCDDASDMRQEIKNGDWCNGGRAVPNLPNLLLNKPICIARNHTLDAIFPHPQFLHRLRSQTEMSSDIPAPPPSPFVLIDSATPSPLLTPPPTWTTSTHIISPLSLLVHQHPPSTTSLLPPLLTLPDVATNSSTLSSLFALARTSAVCPELDATAAHYHLNWPGHLPDDPLLSPDAPIEIPNLVQTIDELFDRFQLTKVIALGVGFGANIFLRAAMKNPTRFAGLILISPVIYAATTLERIGFAADALFTRQLGLGLSRRAKDRLIDRWLSYDSKETNFSLVQTIEEGMDRLNPANISKILLVEMWRDDISADVAKIGRCLLVTGKESSLRWHVNDCYGEFKAETTSWLDVASAGTLVHEEDAEKVAGSLSLFLQGISPIT